MYDPCRGLEKEAVAKAAGRCERALARYKKYEMLVIDEFMLNVTTKDETRDLYELIDGRSQIHSTVFCSQYQEAGWPERLGGGTSAEGIVDRISNNAYRIRLTGDVNMREATSRVKRWRPASSSRRCARSAPMTRYQSRSTFRS